MSQIKDEKINLNHKDDVLKLFQEIREENPALDEMAILSAVANLAGRESPPTSKIEGKKIILEKLKPPS